MHATLDRYHRDIHTALSELLTRAKDNQTNLFLRKSSGSGSNFTPGSTCEEVAMQAVELATRARTIEEAIALVEDTYRALFKRERESDAEQD